MAARALKASPLRTVLTTLGIVIGTGLMVIVLSVGAGVESLILSQLSSIKPESLFVEIMVPLEGASQAERDANTSQNVVSGVQITTMKIKDVEDAKDHPNIVLGSGLLISQGKFVSGSETKISTIFGVQADYAQIEQFPIASGRFYTEDEDRSLREVAVLGSGIAEELFGQQEPVGQRVKLNGRNFEVLGVLGEIGSQFFLNVDDTVYIPVRTLQKKVTGQDYLQAISLQMEDARLIEPTIRDLERMMRRNHGIQDPAKDDFVFRTLDAALSIVSTVTTGISALLFFIALISLVVGGVGIMNVMYTAVTERRREIGLKKALGAPPKLILRQFIYEAVLITVIGGLIGILIGVLIAFLVSFVANLLGTDWPFVVPMTGLVLGFGVSTLIGLVFGYAPAKQAATLDPIMALRS